MSRTRQLQRQLLDITSSSSIMYRHVVVRERSLSIELACHRVMACIIMIVYHIVKCPHT